MAAPSTAAIEKSKLFNIFTTSYKAINDHPISVDVQIPKNAKLGKHPLLIRFHGGGLVRHLISLFKKHDNDSAKITGASMFLGFYAPWIMDYAIAYEAVVVSPNYRLLPESTGLAIMEDLSDFWKWTLGGLQTLVSSKTGGRVEVDLSKTLVQGESSGKSFILSLRKSKPHMLRCGYIRGLSCNSIGSNAPIPEDQSRDCFISSDRHEIALVQPILREVHFQYIYAS